MMKIKNIVRSFFLFLNLSHIYIALRTFLKDLYLLQRIKVMKKSGEVRPPYRIVLETNLTCNLRCYFCYQREIHTVRQHILTPEEIKQSFSSIKSTDIEEIMLIGGEIFVRSDIFRIFDVFEELQFFFSITTNGTLITADRLKKLLSYRFFRTISFSIHGIGKTHDEIVGQTGAFVKACEAMKRIAHHGAVVTLNIVITQKNYKQLKGIVDLAKEYRIDEIIIIFEYSVGIFDYLKEKKNGSKHDFKTYEKHSKKIKLNIIQKVQEMREYAKKKNVYISDQTKISKDEPILFINKKILKHKDKLRLVCKELLNIRFDPEGKLIYCFLARNDFGSLREKSFEELINGKQIRSIRKRRASGNFISLCEGCSKLEKIF